MAPRSSPTVPTPTPEQKRAASESYERARELVRGQGFDYAINLLLTACRLEPASIPYRKALRSAQKEKYDNNLRGSPFALFSTPRLKAKVKTAKAKRDYLRVIEAAEAVLTKNPWDLGTQMDQAEAFDALGLLDLAVFTLDQARQKHAKEPTLNRALARLFEKRGDFKQAIALWQMVKATDPQDVEASHKAKDLAASETIAKGGYVEAAAGTKESPILGKMEAAGVAAQDKVGREVGPILTRLEAQPGEPSLYLQLASAYRKYNRPDRARAALQQGLVPTGHHASLVTELQELDLVPLKAKLKELDAKLKLPEDDDPEALTRDELAHARDKLRHDIANREVDLLRARAEANPNDLGLRLDLGNKLLKADRIDEAITELQLARREEKLRGRASAYLGACFRKRNNWRLAMRNFEEALAALSPGDDAARKEVLFQLATGLAENADLAGAIDHGNELANMDYGYKDIGRLIEGWQNDASPAN